MSDPRLVRFAALVFVVKDGGTEEYIAPGFTTVPTMRLGGKKIPNRTLSLGEASPFRCKADAVNACHRKFDYVLTVLTVREDRKRDDA